MSKHFARNIDLVPEFLCFRIYLSCRCSKNTRIHSKVIIIIRKLDGKISLIISANINKQYYCRVILDINPPTGHKGSKRRKQTCNSTVLRYAKEFEDYQKSWAHHLLPVFYILRFWIYRRHVFLIGDQATSRDNKHIQFCFEFVLLVFHFFSTIHFFVSFDFIWISVSLAKLYNILIYVIIFKLMKNDWNEYEHVENVSKIPQRKSSSRPEIGPCIESMHTVFDVSIKIQ